MFDPANNNNNVLYSFLGGTDGQDPLAPPIKDKAGALYGTTYSGGNNGYGIVYKLTPSSGGYLESVLYRFNGGADGANPNSALIAGKRGALFGTTDNGGANRLGTVFELKPTSSRYVETILYSFKGGNDGATPRTELLADSAGDLYGTTLEGGAGPCPGIEKGPPGCGTVYELVRASESYTERVLYRFQGENDGANPYAGVIADSMGSLYGTTGNGGSSLCRHDRGGEGCGTVFKLARTKGGYAESILHRFESAPGGQGPGGSLTLGSREQLYGTTLLGGAALLGTVFVLRPTSKGYTYSILHSFQGSIQNDGAYPTSSLNFGSGGELVGTAQSGGISGNGTLFKFVPQQGTMRHASLSKGEADEGFRPYALRANRLCCVHAACWLQPDHQQPAPNKPSHPRNAA